jgi:hypothetical protein
MTIGRHNVLQRCENVCVTLHQIQSKSASIRYVHLFSQLSFILFSVACFLFVVGVRRHPYPPATIVIIVIKLHLSIGILM